ncbi:MAG: TIM barrel protein, partial [Candidatus Jordarchaeales archaeon]
KTIDTNAGPKGTEESFYRNVGYIAELAEEMDLLVYLETHGDLITDGKTGVELLSKVKSDRVRMSYDPANVTFLSHGEVDVSEDLEYAMQYVGSIHFKGVRYDAEEDTWYFPRLKDSAIDYDKLFSVLERNKYRGDIAIEVEDHLKVVRGKIVESPEKRTIHEVVRAYNSDFSFIVSRMVWWGTF